MSANNCYVIAKYRGLFYGWDVCAEETTTDFANGSTRILHIKMSQHVGRTAKEVRDNMIKDDLYYPEYGVVTDADLRLPKDGTPIRIAP